MPHPVSQFHNTLIPVLSNIYANSTGFCETMVHRLDPSSSAQGLLMAVTVSLTDLPRWSPVSGICSGHGGVAIAIIGEVDLFVLTASPFSTSRSVRVDRCRSCREIWWARTRMLKKDRKWRTLESRTMSDDLYRHGEVAGGCGPLTRPRRI